MFRARLVEHDEFFRQRSMQLIFMLFFIGVAGMLVNALIIPGWLLVLLLLVAAVLFVLLKKQQFITRLLLGAKWIELHEQEICILDKNKQIKERIPMNSVDAVTLSKVYRVQEETFSDLVRTLLGRPSTNFIIIRSGGMERKLFFELESFYMKKQLEKLLASWKDLNYPISYA